MFCFRQSFKREIEMTYVWCICEEYNDMLYLNFRTLTQDLRQFSEIPKKSENVWRRE